MKPGTAALRNPFSALFPHEKPLRPLISHRLQTLFGFSSIFISTPYSVQHIEPFYCCVLTPQHTPAPADGTRQHTHATAQPAPLPIHAAAAKPLQSSPHPLPSASPSKPAQPPLTLLPNNAPPPPPLSSMSFWADACNSANNRPLQTLLVSAYASCGVTVRCAAAACCAAALLVCIARCC